MAKCSQLQPLPESTCLNIPLFHSCMYWCFHRIDISRQTFWGTMKMLFHFCLVYIDFDMKSLFVFTFALLCVIYLFSLLLNIFSVSLAHTSWMTVCFATVSFVFILFGFHWASWLRGLSVFIKFGQIWGHYIFKYFLIPVICFWFPFQVGRHGSVC